AFPLGLYSPSGDGRTNRNRQHQRCCRGRETSHGRTSPAPAPESLRSTDRSGLDRLAVKKTAKLIGERAGGWVAFRRIFLEAFQDDRVQIPWNAGDQQPQCDGFPMNDMMQRIRNRLTEERGAA